LLLHLLLLRRHHLLLAPGRSLSLLLLEHLHLPLLHLHHLLWVKLVFVDLAGEVVGAEKDVYVVGVEDAG